MLSCMCTSYFARITPSQVDAAEEMLRDFYVLFPELYGESKCTHNVHLLTHLTKYVSLWGPLRTHSAFGFESKNGQLKRLFHGKNNIVSQLLFNGDVSVTLQRVHPYLVRSETERTMEFIDRAGQLAPRQNMISIGMHQYIVGQTQLCTPTAEQFEALQCQGPIKVFTRLFKDGVLYHSKGYSQGSSGKRDNNMLLPRGNK